LGYDEDGEAISSCVVDYVAETATSITRKLKITGAAQQRILTVLRQNNHKGKLLTLTELRRIARDTGMSKSSAQSAIDRIVQTPYFISSMGAFVFTDGDTSIVA